MLVRRMTVASPRRAHYRLLHRLRREHRTHQVLCYQRNLAIGEVVGLDTRPKDIAIAA